MPNRKKVQVRLACQRSYAEEMVPHMAPVCQVDQQIELRQDQSSWPLPGAEQNGEDKLWIPSKLIKNNLSISCFFEGLVEFYTEKDILKLQGVSAVSRKFFTQKDRNTLQSPRPKPYPSTYLDVAQSLMERKNPPAHIGLRRKWMELENIILSDLTQTQKDKHAIPTAVATVAERAMAATIVTVMSKSLFVRY
ncbi:hypothetical protein STEG23_019995, partial [Scotinomys teguina]